MVSKPIPFKRYKKKLFFALSRHRAQSSPKWWLRFYIFWNFCSKYHFTGQKGPKTSKIAVLGVVHQFREPFLPKCYTVQKSLCTASSKNAPKWSKMTNMKIGSDKNRPKWPLTMTLDYLWTFHLTHA